MDAHVFRRLCDVLPPLLEGARLEKIQSPVPDVTVLTFYAQQRKRHLILRAGRRNPYLYISDLRPVAGMAPSAPIMRLRKYCSGRRVVACLVHWVERRVSLLFQSPSSSLPPDVTDPTSRPPETWLTLDLREGPSLVLGKSPTMPEEPLWPAPEELAQACEAWRDWPVITPALRRTLSLLEDLDQAALLADLEMGGGDLFVYRHSLEADDGQAEVFAWPLPFALCRERAEEAFEDPLEAVAAVGGAVVLGSAAEKARAVAALPHEREAARLQKLLQKLCDEETRLAGMDAAREQGLAVQAVLWRHGAEARLAKVTTDDARWPVLPLDPRLSLGENMQAFFHKAARGKRGLEHTQRRRTLLEAQLHDVQEAAQAAALGMPLPLPTAIMLGKEKSKAGSKVQTKAGGKALSKGQGQIAGKAHQTPQAQQTDQSRWPKGVQPFRSSDGFLILRGRDAKGNWALLRAASPHDLWLHVEGGPGSHALIRRTFAGQEIPERTLHEAATLAAVKSWQKDNPTALILCAEARHVKPLRGAAPGTVRVDKVGQTFRVDIDASLEDMLVL